jgi:carboxyl-terminal processing protease
MDVRSAMKVPKYRWFLWAATAAAAVFFLAETGLLRRGHAGTAAQGFELLDSLIGHIRNDYLEERDPVETSEGTFRGLVNSLDPLSAYLPKDLAGAYAARTGREAGPGLVVLKRYGAFPQVVAVAEKSPAEAAGIKPGDILSAIDGRSSLAMSLAEVKLRLSGPAGTPVDVKVLEGNDSRRVKVDRAPVEAAPFSFARTAGQPARLRVRRFEAGLVDGIGREVGPALRGRKDPLVLDLRGCQDGTFEEALRLVNLFVKAADAGSFEGRGGAKEPVACPGPAELASVPVVVWTGPGTAGPAELAAGLLRELAKAKVVGYKTAGLVGKANLFPLKDDSAVVLTTGVYALPSGRKIWDEGLDPDAAIPADKLNEKTYLERTAPLLPQR